MQISVQSYKKKHIYTTPTSFSSAFPSLRVVCTADCVLPIVRKTDHTHSGTVYLWQGLPKNVFCETLKHIHKNGSRCRLVIVSLPSRCRLFSINYDTSK